MDGGTGQVSQGPYNSVSEKNVDSNNRDLTYSKDGKQLYSGHETVSKDGNTMKLTSQSQDNQGKSVNNTEVYQKQ
jgi:hypothetical protein